MEIKETKTKWSNAETQRLVTLVRSKRHTYSQIASLLGRTTSSVQGKMYIIRADSDKYRPPLNNEEFNRRYEKHMEKKKC